MTGSVRIGTSGWHYDHWRGTFYPDDLPKACWLDFYAHRFDTVEINNSFYRLPTPHSVAEWRAAAPEGFRFTMKASRYTTHVKRLKDAPASFAKFFDAIAPLAGRLGPILFQTPPRFSPDPARLDGFIAELPKAHTYAFEFRDPRWFSVEVRKVLERRKCGFCVFDIGGLQSPLWATADFVYVRLHGPEDKYQGTYSDAVLRRWSRVIKDWRRGLDVWCFFDNDEKAYAPQDATRLKIMVRRQAETKSVENAPQPSRERPSRDKRRSKPGAGEFAR